MGAETKHEHIAAVIRAVRAEDVAALSAILREAPEAANWTQASYRESMNSAGAVAFVSERDRKVSGFLIARQVVDEAEILNLAVALSARRKGEGGALLRAAIEEFRARGVSRVFLEVRESNAAGIAFYEKHGFCKTGRRAGYYRNAAEAAVVMEKKLSS